jgi:hypothetical protein
LFVFKLLNGPLCGAEIVLPAGACFVRAIEHGGTQPGISVKGAHAGPQDTVLTIPVIGVSSNFKLTITETLGLGASLTAEVFDPHTGASEQAIPWNQPFAIGALRFAVKHHDASWSERVRLNHGLSVVKNARRPMDKRLRYSLGAVASLLALVISVCTWQAAVASAPRVDIARILPGPAWQVIPGADGVTHVVAGDRQAAREAARALSHTAHSGQVSIHTRPDDASRIEDALQRAGIGYFFVDLADAAHPTIVLRNHLKQAKGADKLAALRKEVLSITPYAQSVGFRSTSAEAALRAARQQISDIGIRAALSLAPERLTISVADHITDEQLAALGDAVKALQSEWGPGYVRLIVSQRDVVPLRGVKTGRNGYELRGVSQIYFP